jgi:hypothetical protein
MTSRATIVAKNATVQAASTVRSADHVTIYS